MKTLVIGASPKPERYAYLATKLLLKHGHYVELLSLRSFELFGLTAYDRPTPLEDIDTVTLYVGPKHQAGYFNYVASLSPKRVIFNPGTENEIFQTFLDERGIAWEEACTLVLLRIGQY